MSKKRGRVQKLTHEDRVKKDERDARRHRRAAIWERHTVVKKRLDPLSAARKKKADAYQARIDKAIEQMKRLEEEA